MGRRLAMEEEAAEPLQGRPAPRPRRRLPLPLAVLAALAALTALAALARPDRNARAANDDPCADAPGAPPPGAASAVLSQDGRAVVLRNGFVCLVVARGGVAGGGITWAAADFDGAAKYGKNVLGPAGVRVRAHPAAAAAGLAAEDEADAGRVSLAILSAGTPVAGGVGAKVVDSLASAANEPANGKAAKLQVSGLGGKDFTETWTITLRPGARTFTLEATGSVLPSFAGDESSAIVREWDLAPASIYAWFGGKSGKAEEESVVQMKNAGPNHSAMASNHGLQRAYALGFDAGDTDPGRGDFCVDILFHDSRFGVVLRNFAYAGSAVVETVAGGSSDAALAGPFETWAVPAPAAPRGGPLMRANATWSHRATVGVNSADFPVATLSAGPNLPRKDLQGFMTGIYASPAGVFSSHPNAVRDGVTVAQMATSIAMPLHGYSDNYNFFDPDDYIATAALLWSNDPFLQRQVRRALERSGSFLLESGQLPHHFDFDKPVYAALSGEVQTGPNLFWIMSCINYAKSAQDYEWLKGYMPTIRHASSFLNNLIDPRVNLASVPGSLMIDVFLRSNFTTDTNAMLVGFLREFAEAEAAVSNHTGAASLRGLADAISASVERYLWDEDHYITQWNFPDNTTRDFVDYDANYIALAHGIANKSRAEKIFARIAKGNCSSTTASWVSEKYYGKSDTTAGNTGDSSCAMGRIAWFESLARKRYGMLDEFNAHILEHIRDILLEFTWMRERLKCDGTQDFGRTPGYFEYPSIVAMLVRHIRYGIQLGFNSIEVDPFGVSEFDYHVNQVRVNYHPHGTTRLQLPGHAAASFKLEGFDPKVVYTVSCEQCEGQQLHPNRNGTLAFRAWFGQLVTVEAGTTSTAT